MRGVGRSRSNSGGTDEEAEGRGRSKEEEGFRGFGVVSKRKVLPFLSYVIAVTGALRTRLVASSASAFCPTS